MAPSPSSTLPPSGPAGHRVADKYDEDSAAGGGSEVVIF